MSIALISFAKKNSVRLPGKNYMNLAGKPLIEYTFDTMKYIKENTDLNIKSYLVTTCEHCKNIAEQNNIDIIFKDESFDTGNILLNQRADQIINSDFYILLQPTNPIRNNNKIVDWINFCYKNLVDSAYSVYKKDGIVHGSQFIENGNFYFYSKKQLKTDKLKDNNSLLFIDDYFFDIDTIEDFKKTKEFLGRCGLK